ncbi:MAG: DUF624 domain-containing protein [Streptococcaceae bacterium]|nr:DUF624 domain-containing protein [Streptococcaceae bacterium]
MKLQFFWFYTFIRYFFLFGFFPATAAVIEQFIQKFQQKNEPLTLENFLEKTQKNFKQANQVGFLSIFILLVLLIDLQITRVIIKNLYLEVLILTIIAVTLGTFLYLLPVIVRYDISLKNSFKQSFFLLLSNIKNTIAMLLGMTLALLLSVSIPVLIFVPVPLFLLSISWFAYLSMRKIEKANQEIGKE